MTLTQNERDHIRELVGLTTEQLNAGPSQAGVIPLEIKCRWSSCRNGRHAFNHHYQSAFKHPPGSCQDCGEKLVSLPEPGSDMSFDQSRFLGVLSDLPKELIRAHYWNVPFDLRAHNQAVRLGRTRLREKARQRVYDVMLKDDAFSGRRARYSEDIVAYAQHATAGCCRKCASYWHGLPLAMSTRPTDEQLEFVVALVQAYLDVRFPNLPDEPTIGVSKVPASAGPDEDESARLEDELIGVFAMGQDPTGLVLPSRSHLKLIARRDDEGGYLEPINIALPHPGAA